MAADAIAVFDDAAGSEWCDVSGPSDADRYAFGRPLRLDRSATGDLDSNSAGSAGPLWIQAPSLSKLTMVRYRSWRDGVVIVPKDRWHTSTNASSQVTSVFPASKNASLASVRALLMIAPSNVSAKPCRKKSPSSLNPTDK